MPLWDSGSAYRGSNPWGAANKIKGCGGTSVGNSSAAERFSVLVSGTPDPTRLDSERVKSSILFYASEMSPGTKKQTTAGILQFTATIESATITNISGPKYMMDSVRCR